MNGASGPVRVPPGTRAGPLLVHGGFCPEINSLAGELEPLSGILMLASVAEHASSPPGMRAKTRGKRSTRDFFDILDLLTGHRFVMVAARATQAVGGAAATKWISLHG